MITTEKMYHMLAHRWCYTVNDQKRYVVAFTNPYFRFESDSQLITDNYGMDEFNKRYVSGAVNPDICKAVSFERA